MGRTRIVGLLLLGAALVSSCGEGVSVNNDQNGAAVGAPGDPPLDPRARRGAVVDGRQLAPARVGLGPRLNENDRGEPVRLDETALLARAHGQFAWVAVLENNSALAIEEIKNAIARLEQSEIVAAKGAAGPLRAVLNGRNPTKPQIEIFIKVCEANGYIT